MTEIAKFLMLDLNIYGATFKVYDFGLWAAIASLVIWFVKWLLW